MGRVGAEAAHERGRCTVLVLHMERIDLWLMQVDYVSVTV